MIPVSNPCLSSQHSPRKINPWSRWRTGRVDANHDFSEWLSAPGRMSYLCQTGGGWRRGVSLSSIWNWDYPRWTPHRTLSHSLAFRGGFGAQPRLFSRKKERDGLLRGVEEITGKVPQTANREKNPTIPWPPFKLAQGLQWHPFRANALTKRSVRAQNMWWGKRSVTTTPNCSWVSETLDCSVFVRVHYLWHTS